MFDFELSPEELAQIDSLDTGTRSGPDPDAERSDFFDRVIPEN